MPRQAFKSQIPPPVQLLKPLAPPEYILTLCKQYNSEKKDNQKLGIIEQQNFKRLYEQKCQELIFQIIKTKKYEGLIVELQDKNRELQNQVRRLQEQRWKGFDYSRLSARGRQKSQKRVVPIIEVKVPHHQREANLKQFDQQRYYPTQRASNSHKIMQYQRELERCKLQIKELRQNISQNELKIAQSQRFLRNKLIQNEYEQRNVKKKQYQYSESPEKHTISELKSRNIKTPQINEFSPGLPNKDETVKKDTVYLQSVEIEIKRLKNELLYKDLLINKLREQKSKENDVLQRHLNLSVQESKKINDQTTIILEKFKKEIILLWKQLQAQKQKNAIYEFKKQGEYFARTKQSLIKSETISPLTTERQDLVQLLRLRRNQKFQ